jgi:hypothetical protein
MRKGDDMPKRRRSHINDDDLAFAEAYLQHELMNETKGYLDRGRNFEQLTVTELNEKWTIAFRRFATKDRIDARDMEDLGAELRLRSLDPPFNAVRTEILALQDEIRCLGLDAFAAVLGERIAAFFAERKKLAN